MERMLDAARADREEAQRRETARVHDMMAVWDTHRAETVRIRDELVPLTIQRREAALAAYRGGTGTLDDVLKARRGELDARLRQVEHQQQASGPHRFPSLSPGRSERPARQSAERTLLAWR